MREFVVRLRSLFSRRQLDEELQNEILGHLEMAEREGIMAGLTPEQARYAARQQFGGVEQMKEAHRDQQGYPVFESLARDMRYALGAFRKDKGFAAIAVCVLALGIGANTAMFSLVDALFLKPLPFPEPERIVRISEAPSPTSRNETTTLTYLDFKQQTEVFESVAAEVPGTAALQLPGSDPLRIPVALVGAEYFKVFGVTAALGRTFMADEDQSGRTGRELVLSHAAWTNRFGADPAIVGRKLVLNQEPHTVIGVLRPSAFDRDRTVFWKPLVFAPEQTERGSHWLAVVGRLRKGVTVEQAGGRMQQLRTSLASQMPAWKKEWTFAVDPYMAFMLPQNATRAVYVAFGAVVLVLLITCANVANLLLARGATRRRELAVRASLGASRTRIVQQLVTETAVLCAAGGLAGVLLAWLMLRALVPNLPEAMPFTADIALDMRVLSFAAAVVGGVSLLVGLIPAWHSARRDLTGALKAGSRGSSQSGAGLRRFIVAGEIGISLVLICGAVLLLMSLLKLQRVDPGVRVANVITMAIDLTAGNYPDPERAARLYSALVERTRALPGVEDASVAQDAPLEGVRGGELLGVAGFTEPLVVRFKRVDAHYFQTVDIPVISGRGITEQDRIGSPYVMVVNQQLARELSSRLGVSDVVGTAVRVSQPGYGKVRGDMRSLQIVGVARNERTRDLHSPMEPVVYSPILQVPRADVRLIVRTHADPRLLVAGIRGAIREVDPNLPVGEVRTVEQIRQATLSWVAQPTWLISAFAAVAALLAAIGVFGVVSQSVTQQRREIGIRIALGARPGAVVKQVLGNALAMVTAGILIGVMGVFVLTRVMSGILFNVSTLEPTALTLACLAALLVATIGAGIPGSRAARLDPVTTLREE